MEIHREEPFRDGPGDAEKLDAVVEISFLVDYSLWVKFNNFPIIFGRGATSAAEELIIYFTHLSEMVNACQVKCKQAVSMIINLLCLAK